MHREALKERSGVGDRERSCDLRLMSPALYQLSYADRYTFPGRSDVRHATCQFPIMNGIVAGGRLERPSQGYEPCEIPLLYPAIYLLETEPILIRHNLAVIRAIIPLGDTTSLSRDMLTMLFYSKIEILQSLK